jgi:hypothetical protein
MACGRGRRLCRTPAAEALFARGHAVVSCQHVTYASLPSARRLPLADQSRLHIARTQPPWPMPLPSAYGPDRSLLLAIAILLGGGLFAGAVLYLLNSTAGTVAEWHRARLAEANAQERARVETMRPAEPPLSSGRPLGRQPGLRLPPPPPVPLWNAQGAPDPPPAQPPEFRPDLRYGALGPSYESSAAPNGTALSGSSEGPRSVDGETSSLADAPSLTADLGTGPSGGHGSWRSEVDELGRQARALSGEIARLNRARSAGRSGPPSQSDGPSGSSTTAGSSPSPSSGAPPSTPGPPSQVPVDGGLGWLAAAGAAYAANRLRKEHEERGSDDETA